MNMRTLLITTACLLPMAAIAQTPTPTATPTQTPTPTPAPSPDIKASAPAKPANDPTFRLINTSDKTITQVFATPAGRDNWGKNRLDKDTLLAQGGHLFKLPRDGNCIYDLKVVFIDGGFREKKGTNLCKITDLPVK